jgi:hypothetical protein
LEASQKPGKKRGKTDFPLPEQWFHNHARLILSFSALIYRIRNCQRADDWAEFAIFPIL